MGVGLGARWLAQRCGLQSSVSETFMAGLFHDTGKLVLLKAIDDCRTKGHWRQALSDQLVMELLKNLYTEHGAKLIEQWNLPNAYAQAARDHHLSVVDDATPLTSLLRVADLACTKLGLDLDHVPDIAIASSVHVELLNLDQIAIAELEIMLEDNVLKLAT